jgi:hypothetical protein
MAKKKKKVKKHSSLAIKICKSKPMLRFHLIPVRMAIIKNTTTNVGEDVGQK